MNILEQVPKSSSAIKSSLTESYKDIPALFDFSNKVESSPPPVPVPTARSNTSPVTTAISVTSLNVTSLSDSVLKYDFRSLVIMILLIIIILAYFGFNVLNMFGNALQSVLDFLSPLTAGIINFVRNSTGNAIITVAEITADVSKGGIDLAEGAVEDVGNIIIGDEAVKKEIEEEGFIGTRIIHDIEDPEPISSANKTNRLFSSMPLSESDKCISGKTFSNRSAFSFNSVHN